METGEKAGQWRALLGEWKESGLSQREFCRRRGISFSKFHYWRHKMTRGAGESRPMVRVADSAAVAEKSGSAIRIRIDERFVVEGCEAAEPMVLERVLRVVAGL